MLREKKKKLKHRFFCSFLLKSVKKPSTSMLELDSVWVLFLNTGLIEIFLNWQLYTYWSICYSSLFGWGWLQIVGRIVNKDLYTNSWVTARRQVVHTQYTDEYPTRCLLSMNTAYGSPTRDCTLQTQFTDDPYKRYGLVTVHVTFSAWAMPTRWVIAPSA